MVLGLLIGSAFLHAAWNAIIKSIRARARALALVVGVASASAAVMGVATDSVWRSGNSLAAPAWLVVSGLGEALYLVALGHVYSTFSLGLGYLMLRSFAMLGTWVISVLLFAEPVTALSLGAVGLIVAGLWCSDGAKRRLQWPNAWVLLASVGVVIYHIGYGQGLRLGLGPAPMVAVSLAIAVPIQVVFWTRADRAQKLTRREWKLALGAGVICAASFIGFLYGLRHAHAGMAISVRNSSIVFAQLLGWLAGERLTRVQWVGVGLVLVGVIVLGAKPG